MLSAFADGVWFDTDASRFIGLRLTATMTVLRVRDGLLLHSPLPLTPERRAAVEALGQVTQLFAPNTFHHQWLGEWIQAFPAATVHGPRELAKKRPDLRIDRFHDEGAPHDFGGVLTETPIRGFRLRETALLYRPARTLLVTDLVHNVGRPTHGWTKTYTRMMGFYDRVAMSRVLRWTSFDDKNAARRSVDALLSYDFDGLIVGHGAPLASAGRDALASALAWLPAAPARPSLPGSGG